ncbi:MAG: sulfate adenylyltransferase subunit CysD [Gammaproteobacteria bacterium]|nr:sulfate adenylyltransferase subunit CysD [Gammaproteobacteria bacterium]MYI23304.1 sulfate adenylyltransferase subunit CysD [Gammaproteobacteria bacterium]
MSGKGESSGRTDRSSAHWLSALESEAIEIIREGAVTAARPVMLYSMGKDSSVLLHLARKAFWPARPPFPLLHIDTTWQFREMIAFRNRMVAEAGVELLVHVNREALEAGADPFADGSERYADVMITEALRQALDAGKYDIIFVGGRRDEEKSRAKERVFSFRDAAHQWDPKAQRPELWSLYNTRVQQGESLRVSPLSNWTEADVWRYIAAEGIPVVPLYFAKKRPVVEREGQWIMVDDERMPLQPGEEPRLLPVRFRTLGCYPLTAAVESGADTLEAILAETLATHDSERRGRLVDHDGDASMERKKRRGYF